MVEEEKIIMKTDNFNNYVTKLSSTRDVDVVILDSEKFDGLNLKDDDFVYKISKEDKNLQNISAVNVILNKNNSYLPVKEESFSVDSAFSTLYEKNGEGKLRRLDSEGMTVTYTLKLKVPGLNSTDKLNSSACIQYDSNSYSAESTSCETWYDYTYLEVICLCTKRGLVVGVFDDTLANFNKLNQFNFGVGELINKASLSIVGCLIFILIVLSVIAAIKDKRDEQLLQQMNSPHFDILQHYIITYTKEGFHNNYSFWNFYLYILKVTHPLFSILGIRSSYNSKLRVFDLFLKIYLTFLLSMVPFVMFENNTLQQNITKRNIQNLGKKLDDISFDISQIVASVCYSIVSSVISFIVLTMVNSILYSEVIEVEAKTRNASIQKLIRIYLLNSKSEYFNKLIKANEKMRCVMGIIQLMNANQNYRKSMLKKENVAIENSHNEHSGFSGSLSLSRRPFKKYSEFNGFKELAFENSKPETYFESYDISQPKYIFSHGNDSVNSFADNPNLSELIIRRQESICLSGKNRNKSNVNTGKVIQKINIKERKFSLSLILEDYDKVSCCCINISTVEQPTKNRNCSTIKSHLKFYLVLGLFIFIWIYMMVFIHRIQQKYGDNLIKICVMPLVSMICIKMFVTANILLLISSFMMYYYGSFFYRIKQFSILKIVFGALVPATCANHHQSILAFRKTLEMKTYSMK